ncbi:MAG: CPXCG motif-containing cysteine-rich protein [Ignavibacteriae bacterium]|nr:CPXCG motif-containing cysteine-rich protein [Ignavibacteriota bacterium]
MKRTPYLPDTLKFSCEFCGEENIIEFDPTAGKHQTFTEDCSVCCRPNRLRVTVNEVTAELEIEAEYEG